ncbi:hypothetical protein FKM82_021616 [Ascaphus truei]
MLPHKPASTDPRRGSLGGSSSAWVPLDRPSADRSAQLPSWSIHPRIFYNIHRTREMTSAPSHSRVLANSPPPPPWPGRWPLRLRTRYDPHK